jgi:hypothetical protein
MSLKPRAKVAADAEGGKGPRSGGQGIGRIRRQPGEAQPWSVPRLRGRGTQGNIAVHT